MQRLIVIGAVLAFGVSTLAQDKKPTAFDPAKLVGVWSYTEGTRGGEKVGKESLSAMVTFTKDTVTVPAGPDAKFLMAYTVNAKATPAEIDMSIKDGPVKEGKAQGIIMLDGDTLKLCYTAEGKRPAKFESTKENNAFYFVLKRAK